MSGVADEHLKFALNSAVDTLHTMQTYAYGGSAVVTPAHSAVSDRHWSMFYIPANKLSRQEDITVMMQFLLRSELSSKHIHLHQLV